MSFVPNAVDRTGDYRSNRSFVVRLDVSATAGYGHYVRCQALAQEIRRQGSKVVAVVYRGGDAGELGPLADHGEKRFVVRPGATAEEDARQVVDVMIATGASTLVLDSYVVDEAYQLVLREADIQWLQFDSHARQPMWADWVVHASPGATTELYEPLRRRDDTCFLLGPRFAVLQRPFRHAHDAAIPRERVRRLFLCFGGGDDGGATLRVLRLLIPLASAWECVDVAIGMSNPYRDEIEAVLSAPPFWSVSRLHVETGEVPSLLSAADLGIISGGTLSYEACAVGLPTLLVRVADNQAINVAAWACLGTSMDIGRLETLERARLQRALDQVAEPGRLKEMSMTALAHVDGRGAERVVRELAFERDS